MFRFTPIRSGEKGRGAIFDCIHRVLPAHVHFLHFLMVSLMKKYKYVYGLSGTLGGRATKDFMAEHYSSSSSKTGEGEKKAPLDFFEVPTYSPGQRRSLAPIIVKSELEGVYDHASAADVAAHQQDRRK